MPKEENPDDGSSVRIIPHARRKHRWASDDPALHALSAAAAAGGDVLLRGPQVCAIIGVSLATLYRMLQAGEFPPPLSPTRGTKAWPMSVVQAWIKERAAERAVYASKVGFRIAERDGAESISDRRRHPRQEGA